MKNFAILISALILFFALSSKNLSAMHVSVFGGYNWSTSDIHDKLENIGGDNAQIGGFGGGVEIWLLKKFQFGMGIGYLQSYSLEIGSPINYTFKIDFLPVMFNTRYYFERGFYMGFGLGYFYGFIKESDSSADAKSDTFGLQLMAGYDFFIIEHLIIGITLRYSVSFNDGYEYHNITPAITVGARF